MIQNKGGATVYHKKYSAVKSIKDLNNFTFQIQYSQDTSVLVYFSQKHREIIQDVNVRIKFIEYSRLSADETIDEQGQTELHRAVKDNDISLVRELLSDDRNVNAQDKDDWTPLHIATQANLVDIAMLLLRVRSSNQSISLCLNPVSFSTPRLMST